MLTYPPSMHRSPRRLLALAALALAAACERSAPAPAPNPSVRPVTGESDLSRPLPSPLPAVAARVNGQPILMLRVAALARSHPDKGAADTGANPTVLRQALQELMGRELLFQEALARGVSVEPQVVDRAYDELRGAPASEAEWLGTLRLEGLDAASLRQELRVQATVEALRRSLAPRRPEEVTEEEADAWAQSHPEAGSEPERFQARQILVRVPPGTGLDERQRLRTRAAGLAARARQGENFAALASRESDDEHTRPSGGRLPELRAGQMEPGFEKALRSLGLGQVSDPVPSPLGYHVLRLENYTPVVPAAPDVRLRRAREGLLREASDQAVGRLLRELEARARIEVFL